MASHTPQNDQHHGGKDEKHEKGMKTSPDKAGAAGKQAPASTGKHTGSEAGNAKKPSGH